MKRHATGHWDANHSELVKQYEELGCTVTDTTKVGGGFPDAVVGLVGRSELVEFKTTDGTELPSQIRFQRDWRGGKIRIVRTRDDVIDHVQSVRQSVSKYVFSGNIPKPQG